MGNYKDSVRVVVAVSDKDYKKGLKKVEKETKGTFARLKKMGASGALAFTAVSAAVLGVVGAMRKFISAAQEQERVERSLAAALRASSSVSVSARRDILDYASALQKITTVGDEVSIAVASVGVTIGKLGNDNIKPFMRLVADMAAATGRDSKRLSRTMAKAFADPVYGLTTLREAGVRVTETFRENIKTLVETGDTNKAVSLMIAEAQKSFEGQAEAAAKGIGVYRQLGNSSGDLAERIGYLIDDAINPLVVGLKDVVDWTVTAIDKFREWGDVQEAQGKRILKGVRTQADAHFESQRSGTMNRMIYQSQPSGPPGKDPIRAVYDWLVPPAEGAARRNRAAGVNKESRIKKREARRARENRERELLSQPYSPEADEAIREFLGVDLDKRPLVHRQRVNRGKYDIWKKRTQKGEGYYDKRTPIKNLLKKVTGGVSDFLTPEAHAGTLPVSALMKVSKNAKGIKTNQALRWITDVIGDKADNDRMIRNELNRGRSEHPPLKDFIHQALVSADSPIGFREAFGDLYNPQILGRGTLKDAREAMGIMMNRGGYSMKPPSMHYTDRGSYYNRYGGPSLGQIHLNKTKLANVPALMSLNTISHELGHALTISGGAGRRLIDVGLDQYNAPRYKRNMGKYVYELAADREAAKLLSPYGTNNVWPQLRKYMTLVGIDEIDMVAPMFDWGARKIPKNWTKRALALGAPAAGLSILGSGDDANAGVISSGVLGAANVNKLVRSGLSEKFIDRVGKKAAEVGMEDFMMGDNPVMREAIKTQFGNQPRAIAMVDDADYFNRVPSANNLMFRGTESFDHIYGNLTGATTGSPGAYGTGMYWANAANKREMGEALELALDFTDIDAPVITAAKMKKGSKIHPDIRDIFLGSAFSTREIKKHAPNLVGVDGQRWLGWEFFEHLNDMDGSTAVRQKIMSNLMDPGIFAVGKGYDASLKPGLAEFDIPTTQIYNRGKLIVDESMRASGLAEDYVNTHHRARYASSYNEAEGLGDAFNPLYGDSFKTRAAVLGAPLAGLVAASQTQQAEAAIAPVNMNDLKKNYGDSLVSNTDKAMMFSGLGGMLAGFANPAGLILGGGMAAHYLTRDPNPNQIGYIPKDKRSGPVKDLWNWLSPKAHAMEFGFPDMTTGKPQYKTPEQMETEARQSEARRAFFGTDPLIGLDEKEKEFSAMDDEDADDPAVTPKGKKRLAAGIVSREDASILNEIERERLSNLSSERRESAKRDALREKVAARTKVLTEKGQIEQVKKLREKFREVEESWRQKDLEAEEKANKKKLKNNINYLRTTLKESENAARILDGLDAAMELNQVLRDIATKPGEAFGATVAKGGFWSIPLAITTAAATLTRLLAASSQLKRSIGFSKGGMVPGNPAFGDVYPGLMTGGEVVVPRKNYEDLKRGILAERNYAPADSNAEVDVEVQISATNDLAKMFEMETEKREQLGY